MNGSHKSPFQVIHDEIWNGGHTTDVREAIEQAKWTKRKWHWNAASMTINTLLVSVNWDGLTKNITNKDTFGICISGFGLVVCLAALYHTYYRMQK